MKIKAAIDKVQHSKMLGRYGGYTLIFAYLPNMGGHFVLQGIIIVSVVGFFCVDTYHNVKEHYHHG